VLMLAVLIAGSARGAAPAQEQVCKDGETGPHCSGGAGAGTVLELDPYGLEDFVGKHRAVVVAFCAASAGKCRLLAPEVKKAAESTASGFIPRPNPGANLKTISHRCYLFEVAFVWDLTKKPIDLPLGCLQGGPRPTAGLLRLSSWGRERNFPRNRSLRKFWKHLNDKHWHGFLMAVFASDGQKSREVSASVLSFIRRRQVLHRVSSSLLGPVHPSFRALSGRLKFMVRRHKLNKDSLSFSAHRASSRSVILEAHILLYRS